MTKKTNIELVETEEIKPLTDIITTELQKHNLTESILKEMETNFLTLNIEGIEDKLGYDAVNKARIACKNTRVLAVKICKEGRAEALKTQKLWISKESEIVERIEAVENILSEKQKVIDTQKDAIKLERERIELARLSDRTAKLTGYGMTYNVEDSSYTLEDIKLSIVQIKTYDDFTFQTLCNAVEAKFKVIQEQKRFEEEQREIAAANAKRILEEQLAQAEALKQKEAELVARQAAIEAAELKAKQEAEARIKQVQEAQLKVEQDRIAAERKVAEELLKSRMSSLFALGFSQQGNIIAFKEIKLEIQSLITLSDEAWNSRLFATTNQVNQIKERLEKERIAREEQIKADAIAAEKKRREEEAQADAIAAKEAEEELQRIAALKPDAEKFDYFLHQLNSMLMPEFSTDSYKQFTAYIKSTIESAAKHLKTKQPK